MRRLAGLLEDADVVAPTLRLRHRAGRLLGAHPLRGADALQLAAALVWCDDAPPGETFVRLDERLQDAARREGFAILPAWAGLARMRRTCDASGAVESRAPAATRPQRRRADDEEESEHG